MAKIGPFDFYNEIDTERGTFGLRPGEYWEDGRVHSSDGTEVVEPATVEDPELLDKPKGQTVKVGTAVEKDDAPKKKKE